MDNIGGARTNVGQTIEEKGLRAGILQSLYSPVEKELADVEDILRREMRSEHPSIDEMVRYGCVLGGKRLRPAL